MTRSYARGLFPLLLLLAVALSPVASRRTPRAGTQHVTGVQSELTLQDASPVSGGNALARIMKRPIRTISLLDLFTIWLLRFAGKTRKAAKPITGLEKDLVALHECGHCVAALALEPLQMETHFDATNAIAFRIW